MSEASIIEARSYSLKIQMLGLVFWIHTFLSTVDTNSLEVYVQSLWPGHVDSYNDYKVSGARFPARVLWLIHHHPKGQPALSWDRSIAFSTHTGSLRVFPLAIFAVIQSDFNLENRGGCHKHCYQTWKTQSLCFRPWGQIPLSWSITSASNTSMFPVLFYIIVLKLVELKVSCDIFIGKFTLLMRRLCKSFNSVDIFIINKTNLFLFGNQRTKCLCLLELLWA